jgi:hypothetical protein
VCEERVAVVQSQVLRAEHQSDLADEQLRGRAAA